MVTWRAASAGTGARLFHPDPAVRLEAAVRMGPRARRAQLARAGGWPEHSPGAVNAWLLLVTTKPPTWREPLLVWPEEPPTLGRAHPGFFYPDPLGFWAEVRRWAAVLVGARQPGWGAQEALAVTTLVHVGAEPARFGAMVALASPRVVLFLDEAAWAASGLEVTAVEHHHIRDPHRRGQVYEGFWARDDLGRTVGKAPQHPAAHNLYAAAELDDFLRARPDPTEPARR